MTTLDSSALKARNTLLAMFFTLTVIDIILVAVSRDLWAIGRIIVTVAVMYCVMQGYKWAKWALVGILSLVVVLLTALVIALYSKLSSFLIIGSLVMIVLSIVTGIFLVSNKNLNRYFLNTRRVSSDRLS